MMCFCSKFAVQRYKKSVGWQKIFCNPVLFHGVITWNNGEIDIAPETVYRDSYAYEEMAI